VADHFCAHGGYLVSAALWLPDDPHDYHWPVRGPFIGCNRLRCEKCGQTVSVTTGAISRRYACACTRHEAVSAWSVSDPIDPISEERLPWSCAGHAPLALPATVDGVKLDAGTDWQALVRDVFSGAIAPPLPPGADKLRGFIVQRLYHLLAAPAPAAIAQAIADALTDGDPRVRACALIFYDGRPSASGAERLAILMRDRPELFVGVRDPGSQTFTLLDWWLEAIAWRIGSDPLATEQLERRALVAPGVRDRLFVLAAEERPWLLANADGVLDADPTGWSRLLNALHDAAPDELAAVAHRIRNKGLARESEILDWARGNLSPEATARIGAAFAAA
jgi:hypothetical protein